MVSKENLQSLKEVMTHVVAMIFILPLVFLLVWSSFNKDIEIPTLLISIGSGAVGFYLSRYIKF